MFSSRINTQKRPAGDSKTSADDSITSTKDSKTSADNFKTSGEDSKTSAQDCNIVIMYSKIKKFYVLKNALSLNLY